MIVKIDAVGIDAGSLSSTIAPPHPPFTPTTLSCPSQHPLSSLPLASDTALRVRQKSTGLEPLQDTLKDVAIGRLLRVPEKEFGMTFI